MSSLTTNLGLTKPELTDTINPSVFATNFDIIDSELGGLPDAVAPLLASAAKIETVTYQGTGSAGSSSMCTVTFSSAPKFLIIHQVYFGNNGNVTNNYGESYELLQYTTFVPVWKLIELGGVSTRTNAMTFGVRLGTSTTYRNYMFVSNNNKTISWYNTDSNAGGQLNSSGYPYAVTAFC